MSVQRPQRKFLAADSGVFACAHTFVKKCGSRAPCCAKHNTICMHSAQVKYEDGKAAVLMNIEQIPTAWNLSLNNISIRWAHYLPLLFCWSQSSFHGCAGLSASSLSNTSSQWNCRIRISKD